MRITCAIILGAAVASAFPQPVRADEIPLGNWTGFAVRMNSENQNRQPRTLVVRKVPDPHVAWRGGGGELTSISFGQNQNNLAEVSAIALSNGRLTFSYNTESQNVVTCALVHQPKDNNYVGDCLGDGRDWRVTLNPPPPAAAKPADAKPAEAK